MQGTQPQDKPWITTLRPPLMSLAALICVATAAGGASAATGEAEGIEFFEKKIRPLLVQHCYKCHSAQADKVKGGLLLDTKQATLAGGETGPAVVPGDLGKSLLIKAVKWEDPDFQMPPKKKLSDEQIADLSRWVAMGAPDPRQSEGKAPASGRKTIDLEEGRKHWAYQPIGAPKAPPVKDGVWARSEIDRFVLAELERRGIKPVGDADKRTQIRRLYFDLVGLPPAPEDVEAFVADTSAGAVEKVVDRLLSSPQFGERWGRHWLDVARYAESSGKERNNVMPHAWRYRDYVIDSFNQDKPYDRFILEQIAGDLLPAADDTQRARQLIATGYLAIGPKSLNTRDTRQFRLDVADEQIDAISQGMMGMTLACARCHDHKFDPIPTSDYYAVAGIFLSTETRFGGIRSLGQTQESPLIRLPDGADLGPAPTLSAAERASVERQLEFARSQLERLTERAQEDRKKGVFTGFALVQGATGRVRQLERLLASYDEQGRAKPIALGVVESQRIADIPVLLRGELDKPGDIVPRGFVQVTTHGRPPTIPSSTSGRLELARWIASPDNPLTARVLVNRLWQHLFGTGIVASVDNFGLMGQKPSHPELLDYLARAFIDGGWSIKSVIRSIVLSRTYQLDSAHHESNYAADPDNVWLWRMSKRRLEAEAIRDAMLSVSGMLDLSPQVGSPLAKAGEVPAVAALTGGAMVRRAPGGFAAPGMGAANPADSNHRSVYLPIVRDGVVEPLAVFDFAEASLVSGQREQTTVPSQALYLLNSPLVLKQAEAMARRLTARSDLDGQGKVKLAFALAFARPPSDAEKSAAQAFFDTFIPAQKLVRAEAGPTAWTAFCQSLLASAEFRYLN